MTNEPTLVRLPLSTLRAHPMNANAMPDELFEKLVAHIERSGRYPPLIVRPLADDAYELLDGHHRCKALERLGREHADCAIWDADDTQAMLLLTTLNRLEGRDDPKRRATLLAELAQRLQRGRDELARFVPESREQMRKLIDTLKLPPAPIAPRALDDLPVAVTFFLTGAERSRLNVALNALDAKKETALMMLVDRRVTCTEVSRDER